MKTRLMTQSPSLIAFSLLILVLGGTQPIASQLGPTGLQLYDDFNNATYDGSYNPTLWAFAGESFFQARQMNGSLVFSNATAPSSGDANLVMLQPSQRSLLQVQQFEARLRVSSDHIGSYAFVKIQVMSESISGHGWWTQCRLGSWSGGTQPQFICDVYTFSGGSFNAEYVSSAVAVSYDTWYTAKIEANPSTANLRFYLNGALVGSHTPNDATALIAANNLQPRVGAWNNAANTYATRYVDDVRITGVGGSVVSEARSDIGMPYNTNRGCPSPYTGCGGPYHGFYNGVCTDLAMDAYDAGVPFDIQNALYDDHRAHPGRYRYGTARNAEDMRRYFNHNQQLLSHGQPYQAGDIAFFDWNGDGLTNHVNVISEVDASGRPLRMVDATGVYAGNPSGRALEHSWNSYYDQHVQAHGRLSGGLATLLSSPATAETLQVLRVTVDSPSVTLRLQDANGRFTSDTYDENLVASNVESFIPYIPGGAYAYLGTGKVISVTQPLSNTTQYLVELTGEASVQYHLSVQTVQDGGVTASAYFTESIALGETQGITLQLSAPGGMISFVASTPTPMPKVSVTPGKIEMTGLPGTLVHTAITVTETGGQQALNGVSASISDVMNQNGQVVAGTLFTVTPASFSVPAGGSQSIQLEIDLLGIQPGIYQGSLLVVSTNGGSQSIPLSLIVRPFDVFLPITLKSAP